MQYFVVTTEFTKLTCTRANTFAVLKMPDAQRLTCVGFMSIEASRRFGASYALVDKRFTYSAHAVTV